MRAQRTRCARGRLGPPTRAAWGLFGQQEIEGAAGLIELFRSGRALFISCDVPELMNHAFQAANTFIKRDLGIRAARSSVPDASDLLLVFGNVLASGLGEFVFEASVVAHPRNQFLIN